MDKRIQAKAIDDIAVLRFLHDMKMHNGEPAPWAKNYTFDGAYFPYIYDVAPGVPEKVVIAKLKGLFKRGLIDGCFCGCPGDFSLQPAGQQAFYAHELQAGIVYRDDLIAERSA